MLLPFSKRWRERREYILVLDVVRLLLEGQYKIIETLGNKLETGEGTINKRALGYIGGFTKAAIRARSLNIDSPYSFGIFRVIYRGLWGPESGDKYLEYWVAHMNDEETVAGSRIGADEFFLWQNKDQSIPAIGWLKCF